MSEAITLQNLVQIPDEKSRVDYLMRDLNEGQRKAAMTLHGPVSAIAGAGSGKTKTLIHRTAHLLVSGTPATSIMLVTFTNEGANEIKTRLQEMVGEDAQYITAGTFHSIIYRSILNAYADHPYLVGEGFNMHECTILDDSESKQLFGDAVKSLDKDSRDLIDEEDMLKNIQGEMASARAKGMNAEGYASRKIGFGDPNELLYRMTYDVWNRYSALCRSCNGIDFDDILVVANQLLATDPTIGQELAGRYNYLMLDEYQDTNPVQMRIMDAIAKHHQNIFVVGDEKQSIYRFRGADISVILGFQKRYKDATIIDMGINYRSTDSILNAANCVADHMNQKVGEGILTAGKKYSGQEHPVSMVQFSNASEEARMLANAIRRDMVRGTDGKDIAVLYRSRAVKALIEQELVRSGIDYRVIGDLGFYQRAEVKNSIAMLRMTFRPWDSMAILRVLKATTFGVSDASAKKSMAKGLTAHAYLKEQSVKTRGNKKEPTAVAAKVHPLLGAMQGIRHLVAYGEDLDYVREAVERLWNVYFFNRVKRDAEKDTGALDEAVESRMQNVGFLLDRFFAELKDGRKPEEVLDELTLLGEMKNSTEREQSSVISLMTIHASKGKEFKNVYIPGMDTDTTPGTSEDFEDIEEERRTFYVGITRAMEKLSVSFAREKVKFGSYMKTEASPFLKEMSIGLNQPIFKYRPKQSHQNTP